MRFEKPFITSDIDAMTDYIQTKEFTFTVKDEKALSQKIQSLNLEKSSNRAANLKKKYSRKNMGIQYNQLLKIL